MIKLITLTLSLAALAATTLPALNAAEEETEQLYRVELLIFSNRTAGTVITETFEPTPQLQYPGAARFLVDPSRVAGLLEEFGGDSEIDPFGRQLITTPDEDEAAEEQAAEEQAALEQAPLESLAAAGASPEEAPVAPLFVPFELLPLEELELQAGTRNLQRSGRHEVLFHGAWIQPVQDQGNALPIILDQSGDTGDWPQLQGHFTLYLSRYLHLQTNLWLNNDGEYLPGEWWMPPPPLSSPSVLVDGMPPFTAREEIRRRELEEELIASGGVRPEVRNESEFSPVGPDLVIPGEELPESTEPPWPYRHAVLLQQARRMRSGEVHYLDHPLLGLVIKLTPVDLEELAEAAAAAIEAQVPDSP